MLPARNNTLAKQTSKNKFKDSIEHSKRITDAIKLNQQKNKIDQSRNKNAASVMMKTQPHLTKSFVLVGNPGKAGQNAYLNTSRGKKSDKLATNNGIKQSYTKEELNHN